MKDFLDKLREAGIYTYRTESSDPEYNAQRNLSGRTHYVDADTLRYFKAKILHSGTLCDGAFFYVRESCARDMNNRSRAHRVRVFDVFGSRVRWGEDDSLKNAASNGGQATARFDAAWPHFDVKAYYRDALRDRIKRQESELNTLKDAAATL